ncbi:hypothetical protein [Streptomyces rubellomurinus]|uniref:Uncharacterized protein n=1 Tax=Streptomyces rubellomurinus (strain ATCC 31215) TaxID=359131 RepID=A0A0F2TI79_STRR3|nr:hypothetical protein [Streptomyces rubellomurinus]KJS61965.1 hypothetical protein VM95_11455 [Streptomyces rubellomurinus]
MTSMHPAAIAFRDPAALRDRCEIGGVRLLRGDPDHESGAVLPAGEWAPLSGDLPAQCAPSVFTKDSGLVEFFRAPATVTDEYSLAALVRVLGDPHPIPLGTTDDPPGEPVTHRLPETGLRPGLHIDSYQNLPYLERDTSRRRLCVNLGPGERYLLLATINIKSICRTLHDHYETHYPHTDDLRQFLAGGRRRLGVLRIRIEPGEGWIAPTAMLPYDESTEDQELPSATASWLGTWERGLFGPLI